MLGLKWNFAILNCKCKQTIKLKPVAWKNQYRASEGPGLLCLYLAQIAALLKSQWAHFLLSVLCSYNWSFENPFRRQNYIWIIAWKSQSLWSFYIKLFFQQTSVPGFLPRWQHVGATLTPPFISPSCLWFTVCFWGFRHGDIEKRLPLSADNSFLIILDLIYMLKWTSGALPACMSAAYKWDIRCLSDNRCLTSFMLLKPMDERRNIFFNPWSNVERGIDILIYFVFIFFKKGTNRVR